jgi:hypothetical protein
VTCDREVPLSASFTPPPTSRAELSPAFSNWGWRDAGAQERLWVFSIYGEHEALVGVRQELEGEGLPSRMTRDDATLWSGGKAIWGGLRK